MPQQRADSDAAATIAAALETGCSGWVAPPGTYLTMQHEQLVGARPNWSDCQRAPLFDLGGMTLAAESTWVWQYMRFSAIFFVIQGVEFAWQAPRVAPGETNADTFTGNLDATVTRTLEPFSTDERAALRCDLGSWVAAWLDTAPNAERSSALAAIHLLSTFTGDESHQIESAEICVHEWRERRARATATKRHGIDGSTGWKHTETALELAWSAHGFRLERRLISEEEDEGDALS